MSYNKEHKDVEDWSAEPVSIPSHWINTPFDEVFHVLPTNDLKIAQKDYLSYGEYPVIDQGAELIGGYTSDSKRVIKVNFPVIVFGDHTRCLKHIKFDFVPGADGTKILSPCQPLDSKYLWYALRVLKLPNRGYSRHFSFLKKSLIPIAPLNEQKRIVAKIEELFSELDKGIENLKTAREQLKVYRQAVLKHAFGGKLTADWREENKDKLESADQLLTRIKREREEYYQQQLLAWKKGEVTSKPRQIKEFSDLNAEELSELEVLPSGWAWAKVVSLFDVISGGTPKGIEETKGTSIPFYKVSDMNNAGNETYMRTAAIYLSESERAALGLTCYPAGTVIFPKRGGAILTNKKRILSQPSCFDLNIMGVIGTAPSILKDYLWYWFQKLDLAKIYDGSNVPQINNKNVDPLPFPVCSADEQVEIIKLLSANISAIESTEKEIEINLQKSEALRQAILKKAFSGELVAQDPNDEPASVLLERIRAEKESQSPQRKTKSKRGAA